MNRLSTTEREFAATLSRNHKHLRIYRTGGGIVLSREAMHSSGVREVFWLRFPNTREAKSRRRRGLLV